jgi:hypothetical protein
MPKLQVNQYDICFHQASGLFQFFAVSECQNASSTVCIYGCVLLLFHLLVRAPPTFVAVCGHEQLPTIQLNLTTWNTIGCLYFDTGRRRQLVSNTDNLELLDACF